MFKHCFLLHFPLRQQNSHSKSSSSKSKTSKDTLLYYLFLFCRHRHKLLLDTGAKKSIFSSNFIFRHNLPTFPSKINHLVLADSLKVTVKTETSTINIRLGHLDCKIKGIVCPNLNVNIIAGLNWLRQLKPVIDWESSVLTVARNSVNHKTIQIVLITE